MNYYSKSFNLDDKYIQHILGTNYKFLNSYLLLSQFIPINYIVLNALILEKNLSCKYFYFILFNFRFLLVNCYKSLFLIIFQLLKKIMIFLLDNL